MVQLPTKALFVLKSLRQEMTQEYDVLHVHFYWNWISQCTGWPHQMSGTATFHTAFTICPGGMETFTSWMVKLRFFGTKKKKIKINPRLRLKSTKTQTLFCYIIYIQYYNVKYAPNYWAAFIEANKFRNNAFNKHLEWLKKTKKTWSPQMHFRTSGMLICQKTLPSPSPFQFLDPESSAKNNKSHANVVVWSFSAQFESAWSGNSPFRSICGGRWMVQTHRTPAC